MEQVIVKQLYRSAADFGEKKSVYPDGFGTSVFQKISGLLN